MTRPPAVPPGVQEKFLPVSGGRMRYLRCGSGPPLVLVHGLLGYSFSWRYSLGELGKHATCYAVDLLGAGFSDRHPDLDCSLRATSERLLEFMDALGIGSADLLGTSYGGAVVLAAAVLDQAQGRGRVQGLVLVSPVHPWMNDRRRLIGLLAGALGRALLPRAVSAFPRAHGYFLARQFGDRRKVPPESMAGYAAGLDQAGTIEHALKILRCWHSDLRELQGALATIRGLPCALLWGSSDPAVRFDSASALQRCFDDASLFVFEGVGHLPYEESPSAFNRAVIDFLTRPNRGRAPCVPISGTVSPAPETAS